MVGKKQYYTLKEAAKLLDVDFETIRQALICGEVQVGILLDHCSGRWCWQNEKPGSTIGKSGSLIYQEAAKLEPSQIVDMDNASDGVVSGFLLLPHDTVLMALCGEGKPVFVRGLIPWPQKYGKTGKSVTCKPLMFELKECPRPIGLNDLLVSSEEISTHLKEGSEFLPIGQGVDKNSLDIDALKCLIAAFFFVKYGFPFRLSEARWSTIHENILIAAKVDILKPTGFSKKIIEAAKILGVAAS